MINMRTGDVKKVIPYAKMAETQRAVLIPFCKCNELSPLHRKVASGSNLLLFLWENSSKLCKLYLKLYLKNRGFLKKSIPYFHIKDSSGKVHFRMQITDISSSKPQAGDGKCYTF